METFTGLLPYSEERYIKHVYVLGVIVGEPSASKL